MSTSNGLNWLYHFYELVKSITDMENGTMNTAWETLPGLSNTKKQLFWINYARIWCTKYDPFILPFILGALGEGVHSPGPVRITGVLQNLEQFANDFNCPLGSNMNPEMKCPRIW